MPTQVSLMQLRGRVRTQLGIPQTDQFFPDDVIDAYLNDALSTVESEHNWPWRETVAAATATEGVVYLPDDWRTTRAVWCDDVQLVNISPSDPRMTWELGTSKPMYYAELGNHLYLSPPSSENVELTIDYYRQTEIMARDEDSLGVMPDQYAPAVVAKACELLSLREDNAGAAERFAAIYAGWLQRMRRSLRRSTGPIVPRIREGSWI